MALKRVTPDDEKRAAVLQRIRQVAAWHPLQDWRTLSVPPGAKPRLGYSGPISEGGGQGVYTPAGYALQKYNSVTFNKRGTIGGQSASDQDYRKFVVAHELGHLWENRLAHTQKQRQQFEQVTDLPRTQGQAGWEQLQKGNLHSSNIESYANWAAASQGRFYFHPNTAAADIALERLRLAHLVPTRQSPMAQALVLMQRRAARGGA